MSRYEDVDFTRLAQDIKVWGKMLGFQEVGIAPVDLKQAEQQLQAWLTKNYHSSMDYLAKNRDKRANPAKLVPNTTSIIIVRMNYLARNPHFAENLNDKNKAYISRYALGRDYHKLMRKRLVKLAEKIKNKCGEFNYRPFVDSAPVLEKPLAAKAGLGWMGKNTLILNREVGSWFFLGTLFTDLPLPFDKPITEHCGNCTACLDICPTKAFIAPYQLDARRCISYLTIENKGSISEEFRSLMGNRIFGCDDCQIVCPWNKFAKFTGESDFQPRHHLDNANLIELFAWTEQQFLKKTEGSAIRRAGYEGWLRNIAVALGNAPTSSEVIAALKSRVDHPSALVREHVEWALDKQCRDAE